MLQQCPHCRLDELSEDLVYCPVCGTRLQAGRRNRKDRLVIAGCLAGVGCSMAFGGSCLAIMSSIATSRDQVPLWSAVMWVGVVMIAGAIVMAIINWLSK